MRWEWIAGPENRISDVRDAEDALIEAIEAWRQGIDETSKARVEHRPICVSGTLLAYPCVCDIKIG